uniref:SLBP_RNA_bind domain-containing protein n=1 Tax=Rodentolepis nana TaxID=102285 RepID=A0A0R3TXF8_RODNA
MLNFPKFSLIRNFNEIFLQHAPEKASIKVQAHFHEYCARNHIQEKRGHTTEMTKPSNPDPNLAATKIQATYRGYRTRKELAHVRHSEPFSPSFEQLKISREERHGLSDVSNKPDHESMEDAEERRNRAATRIQAAYRGYHVRSHLGELHSSGGSSPCYSPQISGDEAATKIQAAFRGYRVRKNMRSQTAPIPRYDEQKYNEAARKIQANYRGYRVRKEFGNFVHHHNTNES